MVANPFENGIVEDDSLKYDCEDERFAVKGFVVDYFTYRMKLGGFEWYGRPPLPYENLLEYSAMRKVALIFEKKYEVELKEMVAQLSSDKYLAFHRYVEVVEEFFRVKDECSNQLSYGQLITLISFGGLMVLELAKKNARTEISLFAMYTSKFLSKRIKLTWFKDGKSQDFSNGLLQWSHPKLKIILLLNDGYKALGDMCVPWRGLSLFTVLINLIGSHSMIFEHIYAKTKKTLVGYEVGNYCVILVEIEYAF